MNAAYNNSTNVLTNFIWRFLERSGAHLVTFIVSIVLARLLDPVAYGTVALVTVFTTILQVFVDSGFGNALIQKKDADDLDFSSVFYFNITICTLLYFGIFFAAPLIAKFYNSTELISIIRVLSLLLIISGVKNIQQAYVSRNMIFKRFFYATLGGTLGAAVIGIGFALAGFGVWALVFQTLFNALVDTIILWVTVKWRPKKMFSLKRLQVLFSYGWKLLVSSLISILYNNLRSLIIGKKYSSEDLAFYSKGDHFPSIIVSTINASIDSVLFPTMAKVQDDREHVRSMTSRSIKICTFVIFPFMMGLSVCSEPIVRILLTEKWIDCVPFIRVFCFTYAFWPVHVANLNAIKAIGKSNWYLYLEIIKKIIGIIAVVSTMWISVKAMAYSLIVTDVLSQIINSWPNRKLLNYGYLEQLKDILPGLLMAVFMGACVYCVQLLNLNDLLTLCIQVPLGAAIYIGGSKLLRLESFEYIWNTTMGYLKTIKKPN